MTETERYELEAKLGHSFTSSDWLERALTHRSRRGVSGCIDNERLEFLGDRVLGLVASERLFRAFPDWDSGELSKGLARIVSESSIHSVACSLNLGAHLRMGPGEEKTGGREKKRLLADAYEAVIGAIYVDAGLAAAADFLDRTLLSPALANGLDGLERSDYKSSLQEWLQQRALGVAEYRVRSESGPEHRKTFEVELWHDGRLLASARGRSKKEAEQSAAMQALIELEANNGSA
ncbi:MAG TPA: ribonuclease III [Candidatus Acidoferrales bacterium]|nr:ribonuclease III [Candidatus Acidoferrales bacterium]